MEHFLYALALTLQLSDAALTCHTMHRGGIELNPVLPKTCIGVVAFKGASLAIIPITRGRWRYAVTVANISSGGFGVSMTIALR